MDFAAVDTNWFRDKLADKRSSQRQLAKHMSLDPAAMSLMLRGKRRMSAAEAADIARFLGVDVQEVLTRAGVDSTHPTKTRDQGGWGASPTATHLTAMGEPTESMFDLPVPLADGGVAVLRLPHRLGSADAERIAALVKAFAV